MKLGTVFLTIFTLTISNIKFIHLEFWMNAMNGSGVIWNNKIG